MNLVTGAKYRLNIRILLNKNGGNNQVIEQSDKIVLIPVN